MLVGGTQAYGLASFAHHLHCFYSGPLGLPDSLLGSAWPTMYPELGVPVSCAGILSMIISLGTIVSSLQSDRLTRTTRARAG